MLRPIGKYILIAPDAPKTETVGGVLLPEKLQPKPQRGTVLAVGEGRWLPKAKRSKTPSVAVGDSVFFSPYAIARRRHDGTDYVLCTEEEILGVVEEEEIATHE